VLIIIFYFIQKITNNPTHKKKNKKKIIVDKTFKLTSSSLTILYSYTKIADIKCFRVFSSVLQFKILIEWGPQLQPTLYMIQPLTTATTYIIHTSTTALLNPQHYSCTPLSLLSTTYLPPVSIHRSILLPYKMHLKQRNTSRSS